MVDLDSDNSKLATALNKNNKAVPGSVKCRIHTREQKGESIAGEVFEAEDMDHEQYDLPDGDGDWTIKTPPNPTVVLML